MDPWQPTAQPGATPPPNPGPYGSPQYPGAPSPQYGQPPRHPHGQYPQQPQYPHGQYPQYGQQPQYPQYPQHPQHAAPPPNGATAIAAAVLSFLGAVVYGFGTIGYFTVPASASVNTGIFVILGLVSLAIAVALVAGGVMLLRRNPTGRIIIAVTCGIVIAFAIVAYLLVQSVVNDAGMAGSEIGASLFIRSAASVVFPILTMVLALLPATAHWCQAGRALQNPPPATW